MRVLPSWGSMATEVIWSRSPQRRVSFLPWNASSGTWSRGEERAWASLMSSEEMKRSTRSMLRAFRFRESVVDDYFGAVCVHVFRGFVWVFKYHERMLCVNVVDDPD